MPYRTIKGLSNFIADIRACPSRDLEERRVEKEITKIRQKFAAGKQQDGYERKKCVWKLMYICMLGYDVPCGHIEALNLISSTKFSEKAAGYIACTMLLIGSPDILGMATNLVKIDMNHPNEAVAGLAMNFLANVATDEMTEMLFNDVQKIANVSSGSQPYIRRKAYLAMLRFVRKRPDMMPPNIWAPRIAQCLQSERDVGCITSLASLILGILELHEIGWQPVMGPIINILARVVAGDVPAHSVYIGIPAPWLQMKLLRILQFFPPPMTHPDLMTHVTNVLQTIVSRPPTLPRPHNPPGQPHKRRTKADQERSNRCNIEHAIYFEAANLILCYESALPPNLKRTAATTLGGMGVIKDANLRCLRLETLSRLAGDSETVASLQKQLKPILLQLTEPDDMIRKQALNLLFAICSSESWQTIVDHLLESLKGCEPNIQEEIVLKIAILVEKFAPDFSWYIDAVFTMIDYSPSAVGEAVWHRVVQMLSGQENANQIHAAQKAYDALSDQYADEVMVKLGAYLLGEFGHLISDEATGKQQLSVLHRHFNRVSAQTKGMLMLAYAKLLNCNEELHDKVTDIFDDNSQSADMEVQQRAVELLALVELDSDLLDSVLAGMPSFPVSTLTTSPLIRRLKFNNNRRAIAREALEDAAATPGPLLKPSTNKPDIESSDEASEERQSSSESKGGSGDSRSDSESSSTSSSSSRKKKAPKGKKRRSKSIEEAVELPPAHPSNSLGLFRNLCLLREGLLLSSPHLQLSVRQQYKPPLGRLALDLTNCGSVPIRIAGISIDPSQELLVSVATPIQPGAVLRPGESTRHSMQVQLLQPFLAPPRYIVNLALPPPSLPVTLTTSLPVVLTNFITPSKISAEAFRKHWQAASQAANRPDSMTVANPNPSISSPAMFQSYLSQFFNLYTQTIQKSICGSGTLTVASQPTPTTLPCLVKLDFDASTSRLMIAIRVPSPAVTGPLLKLLASYLLASSSVMSPSASPRHPGYPHVA